MTAARLHSESFSSIDAAWLHMERPTNSATITGVLMFDERLDFQRLAATIENNFCCFDRFRQRAREPLFGVGLPRWEPDPHFELSAHLHRVALPSPGDQAALQDMVGDLMSTSLDFNKPLWQMHLIENCDQGSALVMRLHHCIADGLALVKVLLNMGQDDPNADWPLPAPCCDETPEQEKQWLPLGPLLTPAVMAAVNTFATAEGLLNGGLATLRRPARVLDAAKIGAASAAALGKLSLSWPDQKTVFKGPCGVVKRCAWAQGIPLSEVKAIGKTMDSTINDVLVAAMAGGLRRYLEGRGQPTAGLNIRALVPVSLRRPDEADQLGNRFGLVLLSLPIGIEDPLERLLVMKQRMDAIKGTPEAVVAFSILTTMGMTPVQIEKVILDFFAAKATTVLTNVPGPRQPLYLAGAPVKSAMFWVPAPGSLGMGLSIMSYNGQVNVGVQTDANLTPDPQVIVDGFYEEMAAMKRWIGPLVHAAAAPAPAVTGQPQVIPPGVTAPPGRNGHAPNGNESNGDAPDAAAAAVPVAAMQIPGRCQALTASGHPCKNRARPGGATCYVHRR
jgi:diacylglycerol O-acyltransferase / wax synthase